MYWVCMGSDFCKYFEAFFASDLNIHYSMFSSGIIKDILAKCKENQNTLLGIAQGEHGKCVFYLLTVLGGHG